MDTLLTFALIGLVLLVVTFFVIGVMLAVLIVIQTRKDNIKLMSTIFQEFQELERERDEPWN